MMQKCKCGLCGYEYTKNEKFKNEYLILEAISKYNTLEYIDSLLEICPHCGLVNEDISESISRKKKDLLHNITMLDEYRKILEKDIPLIERKLLLYEILLQNEKGMLEIYPNINYLKWLYYDFVNNEENAIVESQKASAKLINEIDFEIKRNKESIDDALLSTMQMQLYLCDIYRRQGKFNNAIDIVETYKHFDFPDFNNLEKQWFKKQKKLCKQKNINKL